MVEEIFNCWKSFGRTSFGGGKHQGRKALGEEIIWGGNHLGRKSLGEERFNWWKAFGGENI